MTKTELKYLSFLKYHPSFIENINRINSDALFFIAAKDSEGLENCLNQLIEWRNQTGDIDFPKQDYQKAMEYFLKKFNEVQNESSK